MENDNKALVIYYKVEHLKEIHLGLFLEEGDMRDWDELSDMEQQEIIDNMKEREEDWDDEENMIRINSVDISDYDPESLLSGIPHK